MQVCSLTNQQTDRKGDIYAEKQDRQTGVRADRGKQTGRVTDGKTGRLTYKETDTQTTK